MSASAFCSGVLTQEANNNVAATINNTRFILNNLLSLTIDTTKVKKILYISNFIANIFQQRKKMCAISAKYSNDFSNFAEKCAMANNNIKYQFALDEDGNLISINDIISREPQTAYL